MPLLPLPTFSDTGSRRLVAAASIDIAFAVNFIPVLCNHKWV